MLEIRMGNERARIAAWRVGGVLDNVPALQITSVVRGHGVLQRLGRGPSAASTQAQRIQLAVHRQRPYGPDRGTRIRL